MDAKQLLAARKRSRESVVVLEKDADGVTLKSVTITRPPEAAFGSMLQVVEGENKRTWFVTLEHVQKYVTGWSGFTEADFLGASVGSSDEVEFGADLWADVCADNVPYTNAVASALLDAVVGHLSKKESVAKNSPPA